ncbi:MAG: ThiF family adenylyltransferase, partial [Pseudomonadota bacterium]
LTALNPDTAIKARRERFTAQSAPAGEILIDATDNFETRFRLNALAHHSGRYLVSGAASRWIGQIGVFASGKQAGAPCYQCFVPQAPPEAEACDEVGVVGAVTGMIGTHMALETIKLIVGAGTPLIGRLTIVDGLGGESRTLKLRPNPDCSVCGS